MSKTPIARPAIAGPTTRAALKIAELRATALPMSSATDHLHHERLPGRHVDRVRDAQGRAPGRRCARPGRCRVAARTARTNARIIADDLGRDERLPLRQGVGDEAAEQAEDDHGRELGGGDAAEHERVVGQLQDQPGLGDGLHPRADQRESLADEEQPVVAMPERARSPWMRASRRTAGASSGDHRPRLVERVVGQRGRSRRGAPEVGAALVGLADHRLEPVDLGAQGVRSGGRSGRAVIDDRPALGRVVASRGNGPGSRPGGLVLEQLAELGQAEPGVVAEALDECRRSTSSAS